MQATSSPGRLEVRMSGMKIEFKLELPNRFESIYTPRHEDMQDYQNGGKVGHSYLAQHRTNTDTCT